MNHGKRAVMPPPQPQSQRASPPRRLAPAVFTPHVPPARRPAGPVQAKAASSQARLYPNLRPIALPDTSREQIFTLHEWYGSYGMRGSGGRGHYVPNARYVFVRTRDGETRMHPRLRHPVLAEGAPVMYAGEAYFESGALRWWSNGSGHYRPDPDHAPQAGLPLALFRTWDDVVRRGARPASGKTA